RRRSRTRRWVSISPRTCSARSSSSTRCSAPWRAPAWASRASSGADGAAPTPPPPPPSPLPGSLAGLSSALAGIPINDRLLPDLVSALSAVVNLVLVAVAAGIAVLLHRHLRPMSPGRRAVAFVFLVLAAGAFVSVGLDVDTFVTPTLSEGRVVVLYV